MRDVSGPTNTTKLPAGDHFAADTRTLVWQASEESTLLQALIRAGAFNWVNSLSGVASDV